MPQKRNPENKGFPPRWRALHGAIYYRVPENQKDKWEGKSLFRLGKTPSEAYKVWAKKIENNIKCDTIGHIFDRYLIEVVPTKAPKSQTTDKHHIEKLRPRFGDMLLGDLEPRHIYQHFDRAVAKVSAKRQVALISHAFTKAVEWGYILRHPFKGEVRLAGEKPRTRYIEDWEIIECLSLPQLQNSHSIRVIQAYIRLKLLTGLRRGDLLKLKLTDICEDGLHITTSKTGKKIVYEITSVLRDTIEQAKNCRPVDISPYLFCNKLGKCYFDERTGESHGWSSIWKRFMERVKAETKVEEHFTEHDLRAKVASDADSLERARQLLSHADSRITNRVYRRKPERIRPTE